MHPLTKEKIAILGLATRVRNMKTTIELGTEYDEPEVVSAQQKRMASLSRAIRHRHVAYSLVRRGIDGIDKSIAWRNGIETQYTSEKLNWDLVMHHRIRLSNEIMQYQSDHIERLLTSSKPSGPKIMGLGTFEEDGVGNLVADIKKDGVAYILPCYPGAEIIGVEDEDENPDAIYDALIESLKPLGIVQDEADETILKMLLRGDIDSYTRESNECAGPCDACDDTDCGEGEPCPCHDVIETEDGWRFEFFCDGEDDPCAPFPGEFDEMEEVEAILNEMDNSGISKCSMTSEINSHGGKSFCPCCSEDEETELINPRPEDWAAYSGIDEAEGMPGEYWMPPEIESIREKLKRESIGTIPIPPSECTYAEYFNTDYVCNVGGFCNFKGDHFGDCPVYQHAADIDS